MKSVDDLIFFFPLLFGGFIIGFALLSQVVSMLKGSSADAYDDESNDETTNENYELDEADEQKEHCTYCGRLINGQDRCPGCGAIQ